MLPELIERSAGSLLSGRRRRRPPEAADGSPAASAIWDGPAGLEWGSRVKFNFREQDWAWLKKPAPMGPQYSYETIASHAGLPAIVLHPRDALDEDERPYYDQRVAEGRLASEPEVTDNDTVAIEFLQPTGLPTFWEDEGIRDCVLAVPVSCLTLI